MFGYGLPKWLFLNAKSYFSNSSSSVGKDNTIVGRGRFKAFEQVFAFGIKSGLPITSSTSYKNTQSQYK